MPILYNNFGSFKERIPEKDNYIKVFDSEYDVNSIDKLMEEFEKMLDYVISNNGKYNDKMKDDFIIKYNPFYDTLFRNTDSIDDIQKIDEHLNNLHHKNKKKYNIIHNKIKPFAVYFPQFHEIEENNVNFYKGYTDIVNLSMLTQDQFDFKTPLHYLHDSENILDYDLTNMEIINKQIKIAKSYGLCGFAIYYYWFSKNSITNRNMIMENVINKFFEKNYEDFKVFFIWANENWSDNPSFGKKNKNIIKNVYNEENFQKNINNLIKYFKHENYLKIDNKPIFMLHHPWFMDDSQIDIFKNLLDIECNKSNFDGVYLIINSMYKCHENNYNYNFHPNYKNINNNIYMKDDKRILNYSRYIHNLKYNGENIESILFDFNSTARLFKPNKLNLVTDTINNTYFYHDKMLNKMLDRYKTNNRSDIQKIFLINSWNEWGERMAIEPSEETKFYYLELILKHLMKIYNTSNTLHDILPIISNNKYTHLFHKYILNIRDPTEEINYDIINQCKFVKKNICHFHIFDINLINEFSKYLEMIKGYFNIIITFSIGDLEDEIIYNEFTVLKIPNRGYDIGAKICALHYLKKRNIDYQYTLFLHSKSDIHKRKKYFDPFLKNDQRLKLIDCLLNIENNKLYGIFPNIMWYDHNNICNHDNKRYHVWKYNLKNMMDIFDFLKCDNRNLIFAEGNCMILHKKITDYIFCDHKLFYNILNDGNSFDYSWFKFFYKKYKDSNLHECYQHYLNLNLLGNNNLIRSTDISYPDVMTEHSFERIWINIIKHLDGNYLILDENKIFDFYNIKINALYFPQFHEIPENNKFWGKGFTEWTLLKPQENLLINNEEIKILKPHGDIGYYNLDNIEILKQQIDIAQKYNINGFVIYHYWFENNHKVLYKPLEYFLRDDITFPFCISWANESWTKKWDGRNNDILIKQSYGTNDDYKTHIQYLIPFFKKENYMKNEHGECIFYIYQFYDIKDIYENMMKVWENELKKAKLKIKIICTENSFIENHNLNIQNDKFIFEPLYSGQYIKMNNTKYEVDNISQKYFYWNYKDVINNYKYGKCQTNNKHLGLPLNWNNIIRRKNLPFYHSKDFNKENLEEMLNILICHIILRYINIFELNTIKEIKKENIIIVNAWNEWNEQAVLEPNIITGYENLETIHNIINNA